MTVYKMIVDKKPKYCTSCPLNLCKECGKETHININSGLTYRFIPDNRCKLMDLEELMNESQQRHIRSK